MFYGNMVYGEKTKKIVVFRCCESETSVLCHLFYFVNAKCDVDVIFRKIEQKPPGGKRVEKKEFSCLVARQYLKI